MKWWTWIVVSIVVALLAASCASPEPTDAWAVQRLTPVEDVVTGGTVCDDVRTLALGALAAETDLEPTLDELARIAAVVGATDALPALNELRALAADTESSESELAVDRHDLLFTAGNAIDDATSVACEVPAFSALYATSGFPDCFFEMEIAVGAYTVAGEPGDCRQEGRPTFLPCWGTEGDHLPVDCVSGEIVQAVGDRWVAAGAPREIVIERPVLVESEGPPLVAPTNTDACRSLTELFQSGDSPNGAIPDFDRLAAAARSLDPATLDLVARFIEANTSLPDLTEFETLVAELDEVTADECGLPIVSAWASLVGPVDQLPCWTETGVPYPAYTQSPCV
jgi:hypothetical protein